MTEDLRTMLRERADTARLAPVDLEAVARAGTLAVRRRRWARVAAVAATVTVVAGTAALLRPDPAPAPAPTPPTPALPAVQPTWASGTTLHTAAGDVEVGHEIEGLARTSAGHVVSDGRTVYSVVGDQVEEVGTVSPPRAAPGFAKIFGDTDGTLAAWPDGSSYVVLDQDTDEVQRFDSVGQGSIVAVDARALYVTDDRGAVAIDVDSGAETQVGGSDGRRSPVTWEDGRAARLAQDGRVWLDGTGEHAPAPIGPRPLTLGDALATTVQLSPDARFLTVDSTIAATVYDTETGRQLPLPLDEGETRGYEWLDDDTLVVLQLPTPQGHYRLLTCSVAARDCEVAVPDLGDGKGETGNGVGFTLPIGEPYFPYPHG